MKHRHDLSHKFCYGSQPAPSTSYSKSLESVSHASGPSNTFPKLSGDIPDCQKFRKGVCGQRGFARANPSKARDSGLFSVPFFPCPLRRRGTHFWRASWALIGGFVCRQPPLANPFSKLLRLFPGGYGGLRGRKAGSVGGVFRVFFWHFGPQRALQGGLCTGLMKATDMTKLMHETTCLKPNGHNIATLNSHVQIVGMSMGLSLCKPFGVRAICRACHHVRNRRGSVLDVNPFAWRNVTSLSHLGFDFQSRKYRSVTPEYQG